MCFHVSFFYKDLFLTTRNICWKLVVSILVFLQEGLIQGEIKKLKDELFALEAHIKEREGELKMLQELIGSSKYDYTSLTEERDELQDKRKYVIISSFLNRKFHK